MTSILYFFAIFLYLLLALIAYKKIAAEVGKQFSLISSVYLNSVSPEAHGREERGNSSSELLWGIAPLSWLSSPFVVSRW